MVLASILRLCLMSAATPSRLVLRHVSLSRLVHNARTEMPGDPMRKSRGKPNTKSAYRCQFKGYLGSAWRPDGSSLLLFGDYVGIHEVAPMGGVPRQIFPVRDFRWGTHFENPLFLSGEGGGVLFYQAQARDR